MATSLNISGIRKTFPGVTALDDINIEVKAGEFFTLLGPSGCGKTTLLRTIAGFYHQDDGRLFVGDKLMDNVPAHRRDIGMVFQNYAVFPHMTVEQNVAFGLKTRHTPQNEIGPRVTRALETVQLGGYEKRTPDQLSGGQQQRVGLARAMVIRPRLLLLDEPLSNLDAKLRLTMREEILDIQRDLGITSIYVTHDQEEALVISDRIAVMNFGKVQQVGEPWEIYRNPANEFVATFVGSMNRFRASDALSMADSDVALRGLMPAEASPEQIRMCFRPEDAWLVRRDAKPGKNEITYKGTVQKTMFLGRGAIYRVEVGEKQTITVNSYVADRSELLAEGEMATIGVSADNLMFFDIESGERLRKD